MTDMRLVPIRPLLHRAINAMEAIYGLTTAPWSADWDGETMVFGRAAQLPEELLKLWDSPDWDTLKTLAKLVWQSATIQNQTTVWFIRNYSPEASVLFLLCAVSEVPLSRLVATDLSEAQFQRLTSVMARLTNSTLSVSETPEGVDFEDRLSIAHWGQGVEVGICDWVLSDEELQAAKASGVDVFAVGGTSIESE